MGGKAAMEGPGLEKGEEEGAGVLSHANAAIPLSSAELRNLRVNISAGFYTVGACTSRAAPHGVHTTAGYIKCRANERGVPRARRAFCKLAGGLGSLVCACTHGAMHNLSDTPRGFTPAPWSRSISRGGVTEKSPVIVRGRDKRRQMPYGAESRNPLAPITAR